MSTSYDDETENGVGHEGEDDRYWLTTNPRGDDRPDDPEDEDDERSDYRARGTCLPWRWGGISVSIPNVLLHGEPLDIGTADKLAARDAPKDDETRDLLSQDDLSDPNIVVSQSSQEIIDMRCEIGRNRQIVYVETPEGDIRAVDPRPHNTCRN